MLSSKKYNICFQNVVECGRVSIINIIYFIYVKNNACKNKWKDSIQHLKFKFNLIIQHKTV